MAELGIGAWRKFRNPSGVLTTTAQPLAMAFAADVADNVSEIAASTVVRFIGLIRFASSKSRSMSSPMDTCRSVVS